MEVYRADSHRLDGRWRLEEGPLAPRGASCLWARHRRGYVREHALGLSLDALRGFLEQTYSWER